MARLQLAAFGDSPVADPEHGAEGCLHGVEVLVQAADGQAVGASDGLVGEAVSDALVDHLLVKPVPAGPVDVALEHEVEGHAAPQCLLQPGVEAQIDVRIDHIALVGGQDLGVADLVVGLGARLAAIEPGRVAIELDWAEALTQQHGFLHAGMVATALDSACGYAGFTLMAPDAAVLTIEYKINLLAPARGQHFRMVGTVVKPGRTVTVCDGHAWAIDAGREKLVATMGCTLMAVTGRENIHH